MLQVAFGASGWVHVLLGGGELRGVGARELDGRDRERGGPGVRDDEGLGGAGRADALIAEVH